MFILFKTALLVAIGLAVTQQAVNMLENRARAANNAHMVDVADQRLAFQ